MVDLADGKDIRDAVAALAQVASAPGQIASLEAAKLRALLVDPLELSADVDRLLVSPYGVMAKIPLGLLAGERDICFVPSGTTYVLLSTQPTVLGTAVLALGDPTYGSAVALQSAQTRWGQSLTPLPATRDEVLAVGDVVLLGRDATESAFRRRVAESGRWRAVHFACHALVDTEHPSRSVLALTSEDSNDGFLSVLDILRMQIPSDLVVLSACETGKGKIYETEGLVGFMRAFMFAGTPRVICSLWRVDDEATKALMVRFYELWHPGSQPADPERSTDGEWGEGSRPMGAAAALKKAQEYVKGHEKWAHPYYWAAWVLWGLPD